MNKSYFYAETAFHHQGDMKYLLKLVDEAKEAGCMGIKFQVLTNCSDFISIYHSGFETLKKFCFSASEWTEILEYTIEIGLEIILMPLNLEALKLLDHIRIKYLDIHSVSFNDIKLLRSIKETGKDIILAVGGRTDSEIQELVSFFDGKVKVLMFGFQAFPTKIHDLKLKRIELLKKKYADLEIGYADHTDFEDDLAVKSSEFARLFGATIFEKHITLEEGSERVDAASAVNPSKMKEIIDNITLIDRSIMQLGDEMSEPELEYRDRQLKCVASIDIQKGELIEERHISFKMIDVENCFSKLTEVVGKVSPRFIQKDRPILKTYLL